MGDAKEGHTEPHLAEELRLRVAAVSAAEGIGARPWMTKSARRSKRVTTRWNELLAVR